MKAGIQCLLSCCIGALVAAPAFGEVTVTAVGPGIALAGETVTFEFFITADPGFLMRAYVITPPCALTPQEGAKGTVDGVEIALDTGRPDWAMCGAPCNCTCAAVPVVDNGSCQIPCEGDEDCELPGGPGGTCADDVCQPFRDPRVGWATIFASDSAAVGVGPAYLAETSYTISFDTSGGFNFEFQGVETPEGGSGSTLRDIAGEQVFADWIGTKLLIVDCVDDSDCDDGAACTDDLCDTESGCEFTAIDANCDDGDGCTVDTCDPGDPKAGSDGCVHEDQVQVYADICLPYDPPSPPQPNLDDILCLLDDHIDGPAVDGCACKGFRQTTDLYPCPEDGGGDGVIGMDDILTMLDAFAGISPCDEPCPG